MHTFKKGDRVVIINQTISGRFFIEGWAKVLRTIGGVDDQYRVEFEGHRERADRFVDPAAQADPDAFVRKLNAGAAATA